MYISPLVFAHQTPNWESATFVLRSQNRFYANVQFIFLAVMISQDKPYKFLKENLMKSIFWNPKSVLCHYLCYISVCCCCVENYGRGGGQFKLLRYWLLFLQKEKSGVSCQRSFFGILRTFSSQTPLLLDSRRHLKVESKWKLTHDLSLWWKTMPPLFQALTFSSWSHMWQSA